MKFIYLIFYNIDSKYGIFGAYSSMKKAKIALDEAQKLASSERMKNMSATYKIHVEQIQ